MDDDLLPVQVQQASKHLTQRQPGTPLHSPRQLSFGESTETREQLWAQVSEPLQQRVRERAGDRVDWWAARYDGRISAVVLGTRALIVLEPTTNAAGRPATELSTVALDEDSFRTVQITGNSMSFGSGSTAITANRAAQHTLDTEMSGFLGQFPPRAQQLLQEPFTTPVGRLRYDFYYYLLRQGHGLGSGTLHVWCYLADSRTVTFCTGFGHGYRDPGGAASWELTCWRANVADKPRK